MILQLKTRPTRPDRPIPRKGDVPHSVAIARRLAPLTGLTEVERNHVAYVLSGAVLGAGDLRVLNAIASRHLEGSNG